MSIKVVEKLGPISTAVRPASPHWVFSCKLIQHLLSARPCPSHQQHSLSSSLSRHVRLILEPLNPTSQHCHSSASTFNASFVSPVFPAHHYQQPITRSSRYHRSHSQPSGLGNATRFPKQSSQTSPYGSSFTSSNVVNNAIPRTSLECSTKFLNLVSELVTTNK